MTSKNQNTIFILPQTQTISIFHVPTFYQQWKEGKFGIQKQAGYIMDTIHLLSIKHVQFQLKYKLNKF